MSNLNDSGPFRARISLDDFRHIALDEVSSTNTECLLRARAGEQGGLWVTAQKQSGGRGRRGRAWVSEPGNLYASLLLIDPASPEDLSSLPLAVAVAVYDAIRRVLPHSDSDVAIKWPNDILIDRSKVSGILIEAEILPDGRRALAVGIGINIRHIPDNPLYPVTSLVDKGASCTAEELFAHLFETMAAALALWDGGRGVARVMQAWRGAACGIGEKITVNFPDRSIQGLFAGIDDRGLLMLDTGAGHVVPVAAGDVFFSHR